MTVSDMIDRLTILRIKKKNGLPVDEEMLRLQANVPLIEEKLLEDLERANQAIWNLEATVGKMALDIRGWNNKRAELKNEIAKKYGGFQDPKVYYAA